MLGFREEGADELERAAEALADSDPAAAAQATVTRGEFVWQRGDQEGSFCTSIARALWRRVHPSRLGSSMSSPRSRASSRWRGATKRLSNSWSRRSTWRIELGDDELLGDALNTRGMVRASLGVPGWQEDSEGSLDLALRTNSFRAVRAYINLGSHMVDTAANLARGEAVTREGLAFSERMGFSSTALRWFQGNLADVVYLTGAWDEALALAERVMVGEPHYQQQVAFSVRAEIRAARGDSRSAADDIAIVLKQARAIRDPQALHPSLVHAAHVAYRNGDQTEAHAFIDELGSPERGVGAWVVQAALLCDELGRDLAFVMRDGVGARTVWREAALAIGQGELVHAADILEPTGARTLEAAARLRAAQKGVGEGRRADVETQLAAALAFYREVAASTYVREAEALLAEAS